MKNGNEAPSHDQQTGPEALIPGTDVPHSREGVLTDPGRQQRLDAARGAGMLIGEAQYWAGSGVEMTVAGKPVVARLVRTEPAPQSKRPRYEKRPRANEQVTPRSRRREQ
jgi:hypothetical protein